MHDVDTGIGDFHCSPDFRSKVSILAKIDMTAPLFTVFGSHFGGARLVEARLSASHEPDIVRRIRSVSLSESPSIRRTSAFRARWFAIHSRQTTA